MCGTPQRSRSTSTGWRRPGRDTDSPCRSTVVKRNSSGRRTPALPVLLLLIGLLVVGLRGRSFTLGRDRLGFAAGRFALRLGLSVVGLSVVGLSVRGTA